MGREEMLVEDSGIENGSWAQFSGFFHEHEFEAPPNPTMR